jgi:hypothetical protein
VREGWRLRQPLKHSNPCIPPAARTRMCTVRTRMRTVRTCMLHLHVHTQVSPELFSMTSVLRQGARILAARPGSTEIEEWTGTPTPHHSPSKPVHTSRTLTSVFPRSHSVCER